MTDEQLIEWIRKQYLSLRNPPQSANAEVEWERRIPEPQEELDEDQMSHEDIEFTPPRVLDRPRKTLS